VIHTDIKLSNIMLDSNFNTKLGDFGLARLMDHEKAPETTIVAGTRGYLERNLTYSFFIYTYQLLFCKLYNKNYK
jgi:serine/threonine protein kinase